MQAGFDTFTKFISGEITLVIPVYQRNYDWLRANCEQLFSDIVRIMTGTKKKPHFIGTFVYQFDPVVGAPQEYVIIDGQQRITSIILFAKAIYDLSDDTDLKDDIRSKFIKHTTGRGLKNKCRLRPTEYDRAVFEKLMSDDAFDENNFSAEEKNSALYRNYLFFREKISKSSLTHEELCDAIDQLNIVSILLKEENPQEIFESLNSTGLDLSQADLIRNFLLMPLPYDQQEELYKSYWLKIEELLRPSNNVENFIVQYLITKRKSDHITENNKSIHVNRVVLYRYFKRYFDEKYPAGNREDFLKDLYRYAKFFRRLIFNDDTKFENLSALDKKFYELTFLLKADNAPIVLMYLLDRYEKNHFDEATFIKFTDALISFTFRIKVCRGSGITAQFAGNLLARLDGYKENFLDTNAFWQSINFGKGRSAFPNDKKFRDALTTESLYTTIKGDLCKYLLYSLERAARAKELPSYSQATVEHIMPKKLSDDWKKYLAEHNDSQAHENLLHKLGNLTLTNYNPELGNKDFSDKKKIYDQSSYSYTRALTGYSDWTTQQIQSRAKKLAEASIKVWTLPDKFNATLPNTDDTIDLDSDFSAITNRKPAILVFFDEKINVSHWNKTLQEVVLQLYKRDTDTFRRATKNVQQKLFTTEPTEFKIDDDFYMTKIPLSAERCMNIIKTLVENFDSKGNDNVKENIYIKLSAKPEPQPSLPLYENA